MKIIKNSAGFTLIEVLVAVVVIALGCLAVLAVHSSAIKSGSQAEKITVASFLAESQMELLRALEFDDIEDKVKEMNGGTTACFSGTVNSCENQGYGQCFTECLNRFGDPCANANSVGCFKRTTGVFLQTPTSRTHSVRVVVDWQGPSRPQQLIYESMISAFGFTQD